MKDLIEMMEEVKEGKMELNDSMPKQGKSPWLNDNCPEGVWSWSANQGQVLIGDCADDLEVLSYYEAIKRFPGNAIHESMIDEIRM